MRRIRERSRETPSDELPDTASREPGPDTLAARTELADLIADAASGLSDRDRAVLELAFRHGLNGPYLADALGVSASNANTIVHRLRETIERSLGALLVSRRVRNAGGCPELAAILDGWDGHFNVLMRKRISRHIESCDTCDEERRRLVSPVALLGTAPVFIPAPDWLRDRTLSEVQLTSASTPIVDGSPEPASGGGQSDRSRRSLLPATVFVAALIAALGLTLVWLNHKNVTITPTDVTETVPASSAPAPPQSVAPPPPAPTVESSVPVVTTPPARRTSAAPTPVITTPPPPVSEPPPPEVTPEVPPVTPDPLPWPQWPLWPLPEWPDPEQPRPGGDLTGAGDLNGPTPGGPPDSSVP